MLDENSESVLIEQLRFCHSAIQRTRQSIWRSAQLFFLGSLFALAFLSLNASLIEWKVLLAGLPTLLFFYGTHDLLKTAYLVSLEKYLWRIEVAVGGDEGEALPSLTEVVFQAIRRWPHPVAAATRSLFLVFFLLFVLVNGAIWRLYAETSPRFVVIVLSFSVLEILLLGAVFFLLLRLLTEEIPPPPK